MTAGNCGPDDTEALFSEDEAVQEQAARHICGGCPIADACLEMGMTEKDGVWGGMLPRERKKLRAAVT